MKRLYASLLLAAAFLGSGIARAQFIISPPDTTICPPATVTLTAATATAIPIISDDVYSSLVPIGFTFNFYGVDYTQCAISSNGVINFNASAAGGYGAYSISADIPGNTNTYNCIMGYWRDLYPPSGGSITYTTLGAAPNRKFVVTFCSVPYFSCTSTLATFQMVLSETTNEIEVHIQNVYSTCSWNGGYAIQGVQDATGTYATATPGRNYPDVWSATNDGQLFTPTSATSYTVEAIPYNFIATTGSIDWYENGVTNLGTGNAIDVSPVVSTFYVAVPSGSSCGSGASGNDTVFISVGNVTVDSVVATNPAGCTQTDGLITVYGLSPGTSYTIDYDYNGAGQAPIIQSAATGGTVTITGIPPGTIDNLIISQLSCVSSTFGPYVIAVPPLPVISSTAAGSTTTCGGTDGTVTLSGLTPGTTYNVNYTYNGTPQPQQTIVADGAGNVVITGPAGSYSNITVEFNTCVSAIAGPVLVSDPNAPAITGTTLTNVTTCGGSNGTITLSGLSAFGSYTINYSIGGVAQPPATVVANGAGNVIITGAAGTYSGIQLTQSACASAIVGPFTLSDPPPVVISGTSFTNPTTCLATDGTITLSGLNAGTVYTISYDLNGTPQTGVTAAATGGGTVTFTGGAGTYTNIILTAANCPGAPQGPITLTDPSPIVISGFTTATTSTCGAADGAVIISGLNAGQTYVINYLFNGIIQPQLTAVAGPGGAISITGGAGTYSNITAGQSGCVSNVAGPAPVSDPPPIIISTITYTDPLTCGFANGAITLSGLDPNENFTLQYSLDGTPQSVQVLSSGTGIIVFPGGAGTYSGVLLIQGGCVSNVVGPVTLTDPALAADFSYAIRYGCSRDSVDFLNLSTTSGTMVYSWDFGDATALDSSVSPTHIYPVQGAYNVLMTATNGGCTDTAGMLINTSHPLSAFFTPDEDTICQHQAITFANGTIAPPHNGQQATYLWYFGDGAINYGTVNPTHTYDSAGTFTAMLVAIDFVPCADTFYHTIVVDSVPFISFVLSDSILCEGQGIEFTGSFLSVGNEGITYDFGDGTTATDVNPASHAYDTTGNFTVTLTASYRICPDTSFSQSLAVLPYPHINLGMDTSMCPGAAPYPVTDYINNGNPAAYYVWSTGDSGTVAGIVVTAPGTYSATVSIGGCTASDTVEIRNDCYLGRPNVFTPDGDGLNDYWLPRQLLGESVATFTLQMFNRYGQLVYQTAQLNGRGWDGRMNDTPQPQGVYIYLLEVSYRNGQKEKVQGNVTLLR